MVLGLRLVMEASVAKGLFLTWLNRYKPGTNASSASNGCSRFLHDLKVYERFTLLDGRTKRSPLDPDYILPSHPKPGGYMILHKRPTCMGRAESLGYPNPFHWRCLSRGRNDIELPVQLVTIIDWLLYL